MRAMKATRAAERHHHLVPRLFPARSGAAHRHRPGPGGRDRAGHLERPDPASQPLESLAELRDVPGRIPDHAGHGPLLPVPQLPGSACPSPPAPTSSARRSPWAATASTPRSQEPAGYASWLEAVKAGKGFRHQWPDPGVRGRRPRRPGDVVEFQGDQADQGPRDGPLHPALHDPGDRDERRSGRPQDGPGPEQSPRRTASIPWRSRPPSS